MYSIPAWDQIREHQGQARGDECGGRARKKARLELQKRATQDLNTIEASTLSQVASQSSNGSQMKGDMTGSRPASQSSVDTGGIELAFHQQSGKVFANGVRGQDSSGVGVMHGGHLGASYGDFPDTTVSSNHSRGLPEADGYP